MRIRSITYFCNPGWPLEKRKIQVAGTFLNEARELFESSGYEVQTTRLATIPFPKILGKDRLNETPKLAELMAVSIQSENIAYAALGPALPEMPESYPVIPEALAVSKNIFFSGVMAAKKKGISLAAIQACARIIVQISSLDPVGFTNLNFAALANVEAGAPFFPAAYHEGDTPSFAIATEAADLAVEAFENATSVEEARQALIASLEKHARALGKLTDFLKYKYSLRYGGIDYSLAPFPSETISLGAAMEHLGVPKVGLHGSLASAAILTESIQRANYHHAGFSGLMLPVLEDALLARRAAEGVLTIKDLLLYSAVCGTGLDTIPLPGDTTPGQIAALLLDLATLAMRLDKPLTARLMPVPGKQAGDPTGFDFAFFANSRVMALDAEPLTGAFSGLETFTLQPRSS